MLFCLDPSSILEHPSNKTVTVGESVEFRCVVNGHPTPSITWKRNGFLLDLRQSELDKYVSKYYESNVGSIITLEVKNVEREEESDYYTCKVENDYGILESRKAYLLITGECRFVWYLNDVCGVVWCLLVCV